MLIKLQPVSQLGSLDARLQASVGCVASLYQETWTSLFTQDSYMVIFFLHPSSVCGGGVSKFSRKVIRSAFLTIRNSILGEQCLLAMTDSLQQALLI